MLPILLILSSLSATVIAADSYTYKACYSYSDLKSLLTSKGQYTYQTNSYCQIQCAGYPVAATLAGSTCYCGKSLPSSIKSADSSSCNSSCQGYGTDTCGGSGYLSVYTTGKEDTGDTDSEKSDSGSSSDDSSEQSSTDTTTTKTTSTTSTSGTSGTTTTKDSTTATQTTQTTTDTTTTDTTATTPSTTATTATTTSSDTGTTKPGKSVVVQVITSTISGSEEVITATTTAEVSAGATHSGSSSQPSGSSSPDSKEADSGLSKGTIAGIVIGAIAGVCLIAGMIIACFIYARHQRDDDDDDDDDHNLNESGSSFNKFHNNEKLISGLGDAGLAGDLYGSSLSAQTNNQFINPQPFFSFDSAINGHKRLSNGSLPDARHEKTLRVTNPDETLNSTSLHQAMDSDADSDDDWRK